MVFYISYENTSFCSKGEKKKMKEQLINTKDYIKVLKEIKETIVDNRNKALVVVNSAMIITYYQIGIIINERKNWGNKYIERLANDLKEYGKGYSYPQLKRMSQFANIFSKNEIGSQPVTQIPWGTLFEIIGKSSSKEEMLWYINQTYKNRWSRAAVIKQFEVKAYQRNLIEPQSTKSDYVQDIAKDTLVFDFISKNEVATEKDLKQKLLDNIILFLQELGPGFALVGKEYRLVTPTNKSFYIDLLMYHTKVHSYVVIEVKLDEIMPSDFGQLNFYVNAINNLEKTEIDNDTVGILLCKNADKYVVETSMDKMINPIGVSKYKLLEEIPEYLSKRLNELKD